MCWRRDLGLNDEQGGAGPIDRDGDGAIGHRELGAGKNPDRRPRDRSAEFSRSGTTRSIPSRWSEPARRSSITVQSDRGALNGLRWPEPQQGPPRTGFGQKLNSTGSVDHGRGNIENGARGDPEHTSLRRAGEVSRAIDRYFRMIPWSRNGRPAIARGAARDRLPALADDRASRARLSGRGRRDFGARSRLPLPRLVQSGTAAASGASVWKIAGSSSSGPRRRIVRRRKRHRSRRLGRFARSRRRARGAYSDRAKQSRSARHGRLGLRRVRRGARWRCSRS